MITGTAAIFLACLAQPQPGTGPMLVAQRGGEPAFEAIDASMTDAGLSCVLDGQRRVFGWDKVRDVSGPGAGDFEQFRALADALWRARFRIERGDFGGAEPLLDAVAARYEKGVGPSAAVVHAGLVRCRVERGAAASAVLPWLRLVAAGEDISVVGSVLNRGKFGAALVDQEYLLAPKLPPIWIDLAAARALARAEWPAESEAADAPSLRRASTLATLYLRSLRDELGEPVSGDLPSAGGDQGVTLVRQVVAARVGSLEERAQAREGLRARLAKSPPVWVRAWVNAGIGRSLLRESAEEERLLGIGYLLEVVATTPDASEQLTGVCYAEAAVALADMGYKESAERLRRELASTLPGHPALEWVPLRRIGAAKAATDAGAAVGGSK
ncbi:MAG: hypothetical protein ACOYN0_07605 [Phycisphaerales bacterium]